MIYLGLAGVVGPLSAWLLLAAITPTGRLLAVVGLCLVAFPLAVVGWLRARRGRNIWRAATVVLGLGLIVSLSAVVLAIPPGRSPDSAVSHHFTRPVTFNRYAFSNIVPEAEQVNLGFLLMPYLDPIMTREQGRRVAPIAGKLYQEMERDPDFHRLGSAMGWAYAELLQQPFDVGHYYLYVPKHRAPGPLPAIMFLHGSAGNFKVYTWLWSKLAEKHGFVVIAPSFGFGNWWRAGSAASALAALDDAARQVEIDADQVYLAGLSNGGLGVSHLAAAAPTRFRGLILISPVMADEIVDQPAFHDQWRDRPTLFITGQVDDRVPVSYVERRASILKAGGVKVTTIIYPNEDHFLLFSRADQVLADIERWLSDSAP